MSLPILKSVKFIKISIILASILIVLLVSNCTTSIHKVTNAKESLRIQYDSLIKYNTHSSDDDKRMFEFALRLRTKAEKLKDTSFTIKITKFIASRYQAIDDFDNAFKYLQMIPSSDNNNDLALMRSLYLNQACLYKKKKNIDSVIHYLNLTKQTGTSDYIYNLQLGDAYLLVDSLDKAEKLMIECGKRTKLNAKIYRNLAKIYEKKGMVNKADSHYNKLINLTKMAKQKNNYIVIAVLYHLEYAKFLVRQNKLKTAEIQLLEGIKSYKNCTNLSEKGSFMNLNFRKNYLNSLYLLDSIFSISSPSDYVNRLKIKDDLLFAIDEYRSFEAKVRNNDMSYLFNQIQMDYDIQMAEEKYKKEITLIIIYFSVFIFLVIITWLILYYRKKNKLKNLSIINEGKRKEEVKETLSSPNKMKELDPDKKYFALFIKMEEYFKTEKPFINEALNRKHIALALNTNELYIQNTIKLYSNGITVSDYINYYRIKEACELLVKYPNKKVVEIAYDCGFSTRDTFYKAFEKAMHMTFKEYKSTVLL